MRHERSTPLLASCHMVPDPGSKCSDFGQLSAFCSTKRLLFKIFPGHQPVYQSSWVKVSSPISIKYTLFLLFSLGVCDIFSLSLVFSSYGRVLFFPTKLSGTPWQFSISWFLIWGNVLLSVFLYLRFLFLLSTSSDPLFFSFSELLWFTWEFSGSWNPTIHKPRGLCAIGMASLELQEWPCLMRPLDSYVLPFDFQVCVPLLETWGYFSHLLTSSGFALAILFFSSSTEMDFHEVLLLVLSYVLKLSILSPFVFL